MFYGDLIMMQEITPRGKGQRVVSDLGVYCYALSLHTYMPSTYIYVLRDTGRTSATARRLTWAFTSLDSCL